MTSVARIRKGSIELPPDFLEVLHLSEGVAVSVELTADGALLIRPIDPEQTWFWTKEWQAGEREVDAEIARGGGTIYRSDEEFLAALKKAGGEK